MLYDLANPLDRRKAELKFKKACEQGTMIEMKEPDCKRTLEQNSYLHLLLSYFASQTGLTLEYVKRNYYKKACNPELFVDKVRDQYTERVELRLRSSKDLTKEEMTLSIERFKDWSATVAEIPLPDAESIQERKAAMIEIERNRQYL